MKGSRQSAILEIIDSGGIETQDDIARELVGRGFKVTQATISRDIKELHLIKTQNEDGSYRYSVSESGTNVNADKLMRVFKETVLFVQEAGNLIVLNTLTGSANAAAEVLDNMDLDGVIGSIAGDNTIFVAVRDAATARSVATKLRQIAK